MSKLNKLLVVGVIVLLGVAVLVVRANPQPQSDGTFELKTLSCRINDC